MKAICISACEIAGVGIVRAGEEIELADGFYNDPRVRTHFSIEESSVKDKNAQPPDMMALADARRERFAKSLCDHSAQIRALNALRDFGADIPRELLETDRKDAPTEPERIAKIVELWCDNFGYDFPTDPQPKKKGEKKTANRKGGKTRRNGAEQPDGVEGAEDDAEAQDGGETDEGDAEAQEGAESADKPGGDAGAAQQSLFDKLNGKT